MDPMMNEGAPFTLAEIWPFPLNGDSSTTRSSVPFAGHNLGQQFADSNLTGITATTRGNPARMSHALSQAVIAGISGARKRREDAADDESVKVVVSTSNCNGVTEGENKRQKKSGCGDEAEAGSPGTEVDQKKQPPEPSKDYIHVRARRGQATDSHSLAERARREKISERMKILQDLVPDCNKVIGKALVLDEIINYIQSLQRQVEFLSMKLEAVNSRMNPGIEGFPPKEYGQQAFENPGMQFGSQSTREYSRGASPEWLHMQLGGGFERTS